MIESLKSKLQIKRDGEKGRNPILRDKSFELLLNLVRAKKPKRILEIGTNVGLSSIAMALESPKSLIDTIELNEDTYKQAKKNFEEFNVSDRVRAICGDAHDVLPMLSCKYDFVFIDGPKSHYYEYLKVIEPLIEKGGIIFADNVLYRGYIQHPEIVPKRDRTIANNLKKYMDELTNSKNYFHVTIELEDGVSLAVKRV